MHTKSLPWRLIQAGFTVTVVLLLFPVTGLCQANTRPAPFLVRYQSGSRSLSYVAARHISVLDSPDLLQHPTMKMIREEFAKAKPQECILEGIQPSDITQPANLIAHAQECVRNAFKGNCTEAMYAVALAHESGAKLTTGEPTDIQVVDAMKKAGYSPKDILAFHLAREVPQNARQGAALSGGIDSWASARLIVLRDKLGISQKLDLNQFKRWYKLHIRTPKQYSALTANDFTPDASRSATWFGRFQAHLTSFRDEAAKKSIRSAISRNDRVLVIYGAGHWPAHHTEIIGNGLQQLP